MKLQPSGLVMGVMGPIKSTDGLGRYRFAVVWMNSRLSAQIFSLAAGMAASACLLVCGGLSGDAGALAIRSAEQPGGWGQCGGGLLRHEPPSHPRTQRMKIGFRITTAARKTSSAQGAIIAAETVAPRGCWPRDPRSGVVDKLR